MEMIKQAMTEQEMDMLLQQSAKPQPPLRGPIDNLLGVGGAVVGGLGSAARLIPGLAVKPEPVTRNVAY